MRKSLHNALVRELKARSLDALLITHLPNVQYLSGFSGSNGACVITRNYHTFVTDGRYIAQSKEEVRGFRILITKTKLFDELAAKGVLRSKKRVGIESSHVTLAELRTIKKLFPGVTFVQTDGIVERQAAIKQPDEIERIRKAIAVTDAVFESVLHILKPGVRELEIAAEISYLHRLAGSDADAFEPIVASGPRGALPHAKPTSKKLKSGELVVLDFGGRLNGYMSDLTRTVAIGTISTRQKEIYDTVYEAQMLAIEAVRPGMTAKELDAIARDHIASRGFGDYFNHSLGHGVGLQIHEAPLVSYRSNDMIEKGNVITIEPGIYLPGVCGVRIEDDVVVTARGCENLTKAPKELIRV